MQNKNRIYSPCGLLARHRRPWDSRGRQLLLFHHSPVLMFTLKHCSYFHFLTVPVTKKFLPLNWDFPFAREILSKRFFLALFTSRQIGISHFKQKSKGFFGRWKYSMSGNLRNRNKNTRNLPRFLVKFIFMYSKSSSTKYKKF
jgi:hypothetical protein